VVDESSIVSSGASPAAAPSPLAELTRLFELLSSSGRQELLDKAKALVEQETMVGLSIRLIAPQSPIPGKLVALGLGSLRSLGATSIDPLPIGSCSLRHAGGSLQRGERVSRWQDRSQEVCWAQDPESSCAWFVTRAAPPGQVLAVLSVERPEGAGALEISKLERESVSDLEVDTVLEGVAFEVWDGSLRVFQGSTLDADLLIVPLGPPVDDDRDEEDDTASPAMPLHWSESPERKTKKISSRTEPLLASFKPLPAALQADTTDDGAIRMSPVQSPVRKDSTSSRGGQARPSPAASPTRAVLPLEKKQRENSQLEQSLDSLSFFESHHRGRLDNAPAETETLPAKIVDAQALLEESDHSDLHSEEDEPSGNGESLRKSVAGMSLIDVPILPAGRTVTVTILTTWGDPHYVGLSSIDLFDGKGELISPLGPLVREQRDGDSLVTYHAEGVSVTDKVHITSISADPGDVNVLTGYGSDPRTLDKLFDGHPFTRDDMHSWLAPWTPGKSVSLKITLSKSCEFSMIRIWNYNKSRVHSYRGARRIHVAVGDRSRLFDGECRKAPGDLSDPLQCVESILFTQDLATLRRAFQMAHPVSSETTVTAEELQAEALRTLEARRPSTADSGQPSVLSRRRRAEPPEHDYAQVMKEVQAPLSSNLDELLAQVAGSSVTDRPRTAARVSPARASRPASVQPRSPSPVRVPSPVEAPTPQAKTGDWSLFDVAPCGRGGLVRAADVPSAAVVEMEILDTHGDMFYAGMTAIRLFVADQAPDSEGLSPVREYPLVPSMLQAEPKDINVVSCAVRGSHAVVIHRPQDGHSGDPRTLDKLTDGATMTCDDNHMWLIPFNAGERHWLRIRLPRALPIVGLELFNYNKSPDDASRGVRCARITLDGKPVLSYAAAQPPTDDSDDFPEAVWSDALSIRKAPGDELFPFGQPIALVAPRALDDLDAPPCAAVVVDVSHGATACRIPRDAASTALRLHRGHGFLKWQGRLICEPAPWPRAQTVRIVLGGSISDLFYIGLDDLALYTPDAARVRITPRQIRASPASVNELPGTPADGRVITNLCFDPGCSEDRALVPSSAPPRSWLAPLAHSLQPGSSNVIEISFDSPITLGGLRILNYSKTPERGANGLSLWLDGLLVYSGQLTAAIEQGSRGQFVPFSPLWPHWDAEEQSGALPVAHTKGGEAPLDSAHVLLWDERRRRGGPRAASLSTTAEGVAPDLKHRPETAVAWSPW
jgi:hypothetical protein